MTQQQEAKILISRYGDIRTPLREAFPDLKFNLPSKGVPSFNPVGDTERFFSTQL